MSFYCLFVTGGNSLAQSPASSVRHLAGLLRSFRSHRLSDSAYLKAVDSVAPVLLAEDSLAEWLSAYREIVFGDKRWGAYRAHYYTYMAIHATDKNQLGSAIYYSEKNNEERIATGEFKRGGLSHSDVFAMTIYSNNHDYTRVLSRYRAVRPALSAIPAGVRADTVPAEEASVALMIGNAVVYAACKARDSAVAIEAAGIGDRIATAIGDKIATAIGDKIANPAAVSKAGYGGRVTEFDYLAHLSDFELERFLGHDRAAGELLQRAIGEVQAPGFPATLQPAYVEFTFTEAFDFYFDRGLTDSARRYFGLVKALNEKGVEYSSLDPEFLPEAGSKLDARDRRYREAYQELLREYRIRDSGYYAISADKDNNLYALAAEENTRAELLRTEEGRREAERFSMYLFTLLGLLVPAGFAGFMVYRSRQRQRLLNLQLNLARNFHDEIGPMLLFANALVKKELDERPSAGLAELKAQTAQIMEAVRDIAHDLKSNELSTVDSFGREVVALLEKIRQTTGIDFQFRVNQGGSRILSHRQYTHLTKMMNELLSNSIKHAGCSRITVLIQSKDERFAISYSDDGRGMEPGSFSSGIGLGNIRERVTLLKGTMEVRNSWPEGYSIEISIPFV
ncbi:MAG TPA: ATP-binding protein [Puia sp.]|nr:ATP-binding protein [Puia sp.]